MNIVRFNDAANAAKGGGIIIRKEQGGGGGGGGGEIDSPSDVNFYDYDGTLLYALSKEEFLSNGAALALPSHPRLVCQGWNWSYEDAYAYVSKYGALDVGANYVPEDGNTHLFIYLPKLYKNAPVAIEAQSSSNFVVDWGDGTETITMNRTEHTYTKEGFYEIVIKDNGQTIKLCRTSRSLSAPCVYLSIDFSNKSFGGILSQAWLGNNVNADSSIFARCTYLDKVSFPNSIEGFPSIGVYNCLLKCVVIPPNISEVPTARLWQGSKLLMPNNVALASNFQADCLTSRRVCLPEGITTLYNNAFAASYMVGSYIIVPDTIISLGNRVFAANVIVDFSHHTQVPTLGTSGFGSKAIIIVPDALYDEWIAATNWSAYASLIFKASEYNA